MCVGPMHVLIYSNMPLRACINNYVGELTFLAHEDGSALCYKHMVNHASTICCIFNSEPSHLLNRLSNLHLHFLRLDFDCQVLPSDAV